MTPEEEQIILRYIYLNELPTFMNLPSMDRQLPLTGIPPEIVKGLQAAHKQATEELDTIKCSIFIKTIDSTHDKWVFEGYQQGERIKVSLTPDQLREQCREVYREIKNGAP